MKITLVTTSFPVTNNVVSGAFIENLAISLSEHADINVITPCGNTNAPSKQYSSYSLNCFRYAPSKLQILSHQPGGIPVALKQKKWLYLLLPIFLTQLFLKCIFASRNTQVFHANWSIVGLFTGLAGLATGVPSITTLRGTDVDRALHSTFNRLILRLCLLLNRKIVTVSEAIKSSVTACFPKYSDKIITIPNGVSKTFLQAPRTCSDKRDFQLITVGNLIKLKSIDTIIKALSLINKDITTSLTVVGDGPEIQNLKSLAQRYNLNKQVNFIGNLPQHLLPKYLQNADIFILSSQREGRPNVVLEAMASGLAVIATNIDGVTELIQDNATGLLFPVGNEKILANCINRLCNDASLRNKIGSNARDHIIKEKLFWSDTATKYIRTYKSVLAY